MLVCVHTIVLQICMLQLQVVCTTEENFVLFDRARVRVSALRARVVDSRTKINRQLRVANHFEICIRSEKQN